MRNSRLISIISAGFIASILISCVNNRILREAESLLETNPRAADSILVSMPVPKSRRDRAWYAVLKTQADYKQYRPITSDSLILTATDYYDTHRKNYRSAMAWYTQGCVYNESHDDVSAIESFLKAKDLFPDTILRYYALTEQKIGDVLLRRDMLKEASDMYSRTKVISEHLNDSALIIYSDFKQSLLCLQNNDFENARALFNELLDNMYISSYNKLEIYLGLSQILTFYDKDYYKSNTLTDYCISSKSHRSAGYNQRGINYMYLDKIDSAIICFKESMSNQKDIYTEYSNYSCLAESYMRQNQTDSALHYFSLCDLAIDSIGKLLNHEEISSIILSHTNERNKAGLLRMRYIFYFSISIASIIVLFVCILSFIQKDRSRKQYYIEKHDSLLESVNIGSDAAFSDIFNLCRMNFEKSVGYTILIKGLGERRISVNDSLVIKHDLKTCFKSLYQAIQEKDYSLSKSEFECLICFLLNFDNKDTSLILDKGYSTVSSIKTRLKKKIPKELLAIISTK